MHNLNLFNEKCIEILFNLVLNAWLGFRKKKKIAAYGVR